MTSASSSRTGEWRGGSALLAWIIALSISGYPLVGVVVTFLGGGSAALSYPFRAAVIILAGMGVAELLRQRLTFRPDIAIILFWWAYLIRLVFDLGNPAFDNTAADLTFFVATVLIPATAVMILASRFDELKLAKLLFYLGVVVSFGSLYYFLTGRVDAEFLESQESRLQLAVLNPISLAHVAVTGLISALVLWRHYQILPGGKIALLGGTAICLIALFLSGSRGPLVAAAAVLIGYSVVRGRVGQLFAAAVAAAVVLQGLVTSHGLLMIDRLKNTFLDASSQERLTYQAAAIDQALANPVFGSAYVELISRQYPHNLVIESAIALGLGGLALFVFLCGRGTVQAVRRLRQGEVLLPLIYIQYLVAAQLSASLWGSASFWIAIVLVAVAPNTGARTRSLLMGQRNEAIRLDLRA